MSKFEESNFYKALQDFFINADKKTFLQFLAEFYNRTGDIIDKNNIQDDLIKELRELYLEFNEKGIDENIVREKVNYFLENSLKIKDIISKLDINTNITADNTEKLNINTNKIRNITSQLDTNANDIKNITSELDNKLNKNSIVSMANMGQDVKEAMSGGSVAVVGINSVDIPNLSGTILEQIGERKPLNLSWEENTHYRGNVGEVAVSNTSSSLYHSSIIEVKEGEIYVATLKTQSVNQTGLMFVDDNMTIIKKDLVGTGSTLEYSNYYFQIPSNTTKLIICTYSVFGNISNNTQLLKVSTYEFASKKYVNEKISTSTSSIWKGKKLLIIGDSISDDNYNSALDFVWTKGIKDYFKFGSYENYAIASSTIAVRESDPTNRTPIVTRFEELPDDGDLIIHSAITNDWFYQWTPIGTMESRDIYTLYGALHTLCIGLKKKYKGKKIIFLTGIMRRQNDRQTPNAVNGLGKTLKEYNNIVKEVCDYYSIEVIDMYTLSGLYPFDDELALYYFNQQSNSEGYYYVHPNSKGHKMIFDVLVNKI